MPAIQPARLKQQAALLASHFDNPAVFVRSLHNLLDFYADRVRRPGHTGKPAPLIASYRVRPPVLRQIIQELIPLVSESPQQGLALCDALWEEPYLGFRLLAATLLGQIPPDQYEQVVHRLQTWITPDLDDHLTTILLDQSLSRLHRERPQIPLTLVQDWLASSNTFQQQLGLRALLPMIQDPGFENLPAFFRLLHPFIRQAPPPLRVDILEALLALVHRSPQETAYFLQQTLELSNCPDTPWLVRQSLPEFPPGIQKDLRAAVRSRSKAQK